MPNYSKWMFQNVNFNHRKLDARVTTKHTLLYQWDAKWNKHYPPPHFRFNSRRTRLEDPIIGDIEPCTPRNGTPERPNHPDGSASPRRANQILSRWSRWSISSSLFSRWDYLPSFKSHEWIFAAAVTSPPDVCGTLILFLIFVRPKICRQEEGPCWVIQVCINENHHIFYSLWCFKLH